MSEQSMEQQVQKNEGETAAGTGGQKKSGGKAGKLLKGTGIVLLAGCLVASLGLNIYQADQSAKQNKKVNKFIDNQLELQAEAQEQENTYQEDGYLIGGEYEIRSTTQISDAYISGDASGLNEEDAKTLELATKVLDEVIKDGMSNYEKEVAVYDWMFHNVGQGSGSVISMPGANASSYTPYGVLTTKNSVCVGYATTFRMFMNMLGMDCHIVHNEYHSWDLLQLDDGEWYQTDIYSDVAANCEYQNFNMTDAIARNSHDWDDSALPAANGVKYSYAVQNKEEIKDIYAVPKKLKKAMDKKKTSVFYSFKNPLDEDDFGVADYLVTQLNIAIMSSPGYETYSMNASWYPDGNDHYILGLYLMNYAGGSTASVIDETSEEGQKINQEITEIFGVDPTMYGGMDEYGYEEGITDVNYTDDTGKVEDVDKSTEPAKADEDGE